LSRLEVPALNPVNPEQSIKTTLPVLRRALSDAPWVALAILAAGYVAAVVRMDAGNPPPGGSRPEMVLVQALIEGIPTAVAVLALGIIMAVVQQETQPGTMTPRVRRLLYWTPRVATLLFAALVSMFALDVFGEGFGFWGTALALFMHLIPTFVLLVAVAIAWRWPWVGAVALIGWSAWYLIAFSGRGFYFPVYVYLSVLPFLLGVLFLLNWRYRAEFRPEHGPSAGAAGPVAPAGQAAAAPPVAGFTHA
jgi:hypothetical protein